MKIFSLLLLLYLTLFSVVIAQGLFPRWLPFMMDGGGAGGESGGEKGKSEKEIEGWIKGIVSLLVIVIIIIILLILGGVIKKPSGGIPGFLILFIILIIALFVIPMYIEYPSTLVVPKEYQQYELPQEAKEVLKMLGLPETWLYVPAIIYLFILPFAAIYTLVWAFLQSLGIFTNVPSSVNRVLAFIIAFLTIPIGWFVKLVWVLFSFMGAWSVVIFVVTFVVGVFFRGLTISRRELEEYRSIEKHRKEVLSKIIRDLSEAVKEGSVDAMERAIKRNMDRVKAFSEEAHQNLSTALTYPDNPDKMKELISKAVEELRGLR